MLAFLFPGQGSQYAGMHKKWMEHEIFQETIREASNYVNIDFVDFLEKGNEEELKKTAITQPLILIMSTGIHRVLKEKGYRENMVLGHSLGSYSALVASGVISFKDGVKIARRRGELVEEYLGEDFKGGLLAIMGLSEDEVRDILKAHPHIDITNINTPEQIVVGGKEEELNSLSVELKSRGVRFLKLSVSHPFHTRHLRKIQPAFKNYLEKYEFMKPAVNYLSPSLGDTLKDGNAIKEKLVEELVAPVNFVKAVRKAKEMGANTFIEVGPKDVLSKITKKIFPESMVISADLDANKLLEGKVSDA